MQMYTGNKLGEPQEKRVRECSKILFSPLFGTEWGVTTDNLFLHMLQTGRVFSCSDSHAYRNSEEEWPQHPKHVHKGERKISISSLYGFYGNLTLTSYVPKKNMKVIVLSVE